MHLKTNNSTTSVITDKGRNKTSLQEFAENIYKICVENSAIFKILWIRHNKTDLKTMKTQKQNKNAILSLVSRYIWCKCIYRFMVKRKQLFNPTNILNPSSYSVHKTKQL